MKNNFITSIREYINKKFGDVKEWELPIYLLENNVELFLKSQEEIKKLGLSVLDRNGNVKPNPFIKVANDAQIQILKLLTQFGLTAYSLSKLNIAQTEDVNTIDNDIKSLFE